MTIVVSGCGQWVVDLLDYLIMKSPYSSCLHTFGCPHPYFLYTFCKHYLFLFFGGVGYFSNFIRERIILINSDT